MPATSLTVGRPATDRCGSARFKRLISGISVEARWLWLAVFVFVSVSCWWLTQDNRIPDYDSGTHMTIAGTDYQALVQGHLSQPFTTYNTYPPLVHLVGALSVFIVGFHPMAMTLTSNLLFVPLLAFGCYGVGTIVQGPRAGLLAGLFALGTPMLVSMMRNFDLDPPQAAMVAASVWAMLASRRFEHIGLSALAGLLCALALLTKETTAIFLAGLLITVIVRGGWRNWQGLLLFDLRAGDRRWSVVCLPLHSAHSDVLADCPTLG